jgi:hypothetical protein
MPREEIITGLKNALERNQSLEKAMQSMISAGYDANEVREASQYVNIGVAPKIQASTSQVLQAQPAQQIPQIQQETSQYQKLPSNNQTNREIMNQFGLEKPKKKKFPKIIIILLIILLIIIFGLIMLALFGEKILDAIFSQV